MSRIARKGFVYYRAETDRFFDIKIKRLRKEFSCQGYSVYDYFVNEIYRVEGCFMQYSTDEAFCCADYWNIEESEVNRIISYCAEIGLFDAGLFSTKQILTSRSIQENYVDMCRVMKRQPCLPSEISLLPSAAPCAEDAASRPRAARTNVPSAGNVLVEKQPSVEEAIALARQFNQGIIPEESGIIREKSSINKRKENISSSTPPSDLPEGVGGKDEEEDNLVHEMEGLGLSAERIREALLLRRAYPEMPLSRAIATIRADTTYQVNCSNYLLPLIENYRAKYNACFRPKEEDSRRIRELERMGIPPGIIRDILAKSRHAPGVLDAAIKETRNNNRIKSPTAFILSRMKNISA